MDGDEISIPITVDAFAKKTSFSQQIQPCIEEW